ncbi:hypothetical protein FisN_13Hu091 [Fistulifera solaris]|jgi:hypothetical protein|uniref:Uncharacterized protein n=1 Tax=Fistulifera solaris TaxID=1519565 RepID=A0A1Z5KNY6_FISSO|nr:hypothetical protein FisN_13Hu091 [Fistulifera solaris]|eukprot:GAX27802.1 hypothetical protein FisN_13Hu091 [Fistulifera solaris]
MSSDRENDSPLLELIPADRCKSQQVARWTEFGPSPYKLLREPKTMKEWINYGNYLGIDHANGTMSYLTRCSYDRRNPLDATQSILSLSIHYARGEMVQFTIVGSTDNAVAETATFWITAEKLPDGSHDLCVCGRGGFIGFRGAQAPCLKHLLQVAPSRWVEFRNLVFNAEQAVTLATRPDQIKLSFMDCMFEDGGTAFVTALQERQSPFGLLSFDSLTTEGKNSLSDDNMKLLFQVGTINELLLSRLHGELALLAFSAKVDHLDYTASSASLLSADLQSVNMAAKKLTVHITNSDESFLTEALVAFWRRVAAVGHFVELKITWASDSLDVPERVIHEIIHATRNNPDLKILAFGEDELNFEPHMEILLEGLKDHKNLSTFIIDVYSESLGPDYSHLRKLISHNRNIVVINTSDTIYTDGSTIDDLYSINRFYRGSADLVIKPLTLRASLVATALTEIASNDFRRSALLLSQHVDALHEFVLFADLEERLGDSACSRPKRTMRIQPCRATKRAPKFLT